DDSFLTALNLRQLVAQPDGRFDYVFKASISDSRDVDYYRIQAPTAPAGQPTVLTALIWGLEPLSSNGLDPRVTVYNASHVAVPFDVLVSDTGTYALQVANAVAGATYYVKVSAAQPQGSNNVGNYFLGVDFGKRSVALDTFVSGTLQQGSSQVTYNLTIGESQL